MSASTDATSTDMLPIARNLGAVMSPEQPTFGDDEISAPPPVSVSVLLKVAPTVAAQAQNVRQVPHTGVKRERENSCASSGEKANALAKVCTASNPAKPAKPTYEELERQLVNLQYMYGVLLAKNVCALRSTGKAAAEA